MTQKELAALEEHDLKAMHNWFERGTEKSGESVPDLPDTKTQEIWSEAVEALITMRPDSLQDVKNRIQISGMPARSKKWWHRVLSAAIGAPPSELKKILEETIPMPNHLQAECYDASAFLIVEKEMRRELRRRFEEKQKEEEHLQELKGQAAEAGKTLEDAKENLRRHIVSGS